MEENVDEAEALREREDLKRVKGIVFRVGLWV